MACVCLCASARAYTVAEEWATRGSQHATYDARRNVRRSSGLHSTCSSQRTAAPTKPTGTVTAKPTMAAVDAVVLHEPKPEAARASTCDVRPPPPCRRCACVRTRADSVRVCLRPCIRACVCAYIACVSAYTRAKARACVRAPESTEWQVCNRLLSDRQRNALRTIVSTEGALSSSLPL